MKKCSDYSPHDHKTRASMKAMGKPQGSLDALKAQRAAVKKQIGAVNSAMKAGKRK